MKVLIAVDDSPYSKEVVESIIERKWPEDVYFKILTVVEPLCVACDNGEEPEYVNILDKVQAKRKETAQKLCEKTRKKMEERIPGAIIHFEIREGQPRYEIFSAAVDWEADKILIGAHGRDVCPHNLLGSVSRATISHAPCSVEIVRSKRHKTKKLESVAQAATAAK